MKTGVKAFLWIFCVVAVPIAIIGMSFYFSYSAAVGGEGKEVSTGPLVIGKIQSAAQTGNFVNRNPQIEFSIQFFTQEGIQTTANDREIIPQLDLSQVQPGTLVPVRYNPKNPQDIMIDFNADSALVNKAMDQYESATGNSSPNDANLKKNGIQTK